MEINPLREHNLYWVPSTQSFRLIQHEITVFPDSWATVYEYTLSGYKKSEIPEDELEPSLKGAIHILHHNISYDAMFWQFSTLMVCLNADLTFKRVWIMQDTFMWRPIP